MPKLRVVLSRPIPEDRMAEAALAAHSFYRPKDLFWTSLHEGEREFSLSSRSIGNPSKVAEIEMDLRWYRTVNVSKRVTLPQSYLHRSMGGRF